MKTMKFFSPEARNGAGTRPWKISPVHRSPARDRRRRCTVSRQPSARVFRPRQAERQHAQSGHLDGRHQKHLATAEGFHCRIFLLTRPNRALKLIVIYPKRPGWPKDELLAGEILQIEAGRNARFGATAPRSSDRWARAMPRDASLYPKLDIVLLIAHPETPDFALARIRHQKESFPVVLGSRTITSCPTP